MINGTHVRGGFNIGIIVASIVAILAVRRSAMFPIVVAPPIVYSAASGILLYLRSGGLHDRKVLIDTAANWLVYGFPAIAAATAAVLIIRRHPDRHAPLAERLPRPHPGAWQLGHQNRFRPSSTSVRTSMPQTRHGKPLRRYTYTASSRLSGLHAAARCSGRTR